VTGASTYSVFTGDATSTLAAGTWEFVIVAANGKGEERGKAMAILGAIIGAICLGIADMLMKSGKWFWGATLYLISAIPAYLAFQSPSYRWIFNVWAATAVIFTVGVSVGYYQEPMTLRKYLVSGLILAAMLLEG